MLDCSTMSKQAYVYQTFLAGIKNNEASLQLDIHNHHDQSILFSGYAIYQHTIQYL